MATDLKRQERRAIGRALLIVVTGLLLAASGFSLFNGQNDARTALIERFELRAAIASDFLATYVADLMSAQARTAVQYLSDLDPSHDDLARASASLGFQASVLLDSDGHLLQVFPQKVEMLGQDMTVAYHHLLRARQGLVAVSDVVPSAVDGIPITAFAVPFDTSFGRRVFSGALAIVSTPLKAFLNEVSPIANSEAYLVDSLGATVASDTVAGIQDQNSPLVEALASSDRGQYRIGPEAGWFVSVAVSGTPWHLIIAAPEADIFAPLSGAAMWTPWLLFGTLVGCAIAILLLMWRLSLARAEKFRETERLSLTDTLTGLLNRRGFEVHGEQMLRTAARADQMVGIIYFDLNRLKSINDRFGHERGDQAIQSFGTLLAMTFRESDVLARLGGDEFAVLTWAIDGPDLTPIRARLDDHVLHHNARVAEGMEIEFSCGVSWTDSRRPLSLAELVKMADGEKYLEKRSQGAAVVADTAAARQSATD